MNQVQPNARVSNTQPKQRDARHTHDAMDDQFEISAAK